MVLAANIEMKLSGPDYSQMSRDAALADFRTRVANYEQVYETIGDAEEARGVSYIKLIGIFRSQVYGGLLGGRCWKEDCGQ